MTSMPKLVFTIAIAFFAFACMDCHREVEQEEYPALPSLHITMTSLQLDSILAQRDNKVSAYALLTDVDGDTLFQGNLTHIKTRGNTSFDENKKSFTIKFPKKQVFFGLDRGKTFVLLANACDESYIRNAIALDLALAFGIPAPRYAYLTVYINDTYWGLYQITNKVHVGKDALDITDLDKRNEWYNPKPLQEYEWYGSGRKNQVVQRKGVQLDNDPEDFTGGYLLDNTTINSYQKSLSGFVSNAEDNIRIHSPKYASPREVDYIAKLYNEMESAVRAPDGICPESGKHYSDYIDVESFARYYLLNELLLNLDGGWASFFMYKDTDVNDPKIYAGPAWDYDRALDNSHFLKDVCVLPNELFVCEKNKKVGVACSGGLFYYLCQHEVFQQVVCDCYMNEISSACHRYLEEHSFDSLASLLSHEADMDNAKYKTRQSADYASATQRAVSFLRERIAFFDKYYSSKDEGYVLVRYEREYQKNLTFCYLLGEPVNAPQLTPVVNNHDPIYAMYYPGTDSIVPDGTIFRIPQKLELRKREPTDREVLMRRIRKKLAKIGLDF